MATDWNESEDISMENDEDLINLGFQGGFDNPDAKLDPVDYIARDLV